jgi:hypothetical protein
VTSKELSLINSLVREVFVDWFFLSKNWNSLLTNA